MGSAARTQPALAGPEARIQALEDENALLKEKLQALTYLDRAAWLAAGLKLDPKGAQIVAILWRRSPGIVRKEALYTLLYADDVDGGPEPKIIDVFLCNIRRALKRRDALGDIVTHWGVGLSASPDLCRWLEAAWNRWHAADAAVHQAAADSGRRSLVAGCTTCAGDAELWEGAQALDDAVRHRDQTGHVTWCASARQLGRKTVLGA